MIQNFMNLLNVNNAYGSALSQPLPLKKSNYQLPRQNMPLKLVMREQTVPAIYPLNDVH